ncbi:MAG: group II intron reverse transcriptase/maturase, partial [Cyanobacteria bacterium J06635_10]
PKEEINHKKSTTRSAKGSNPYVDGVLVLDSGGTITAEVEGGQLELSLPFNAGSHHNGTGLKVEELIRSLERGETTDVYSRMLHRSVFLFVYSKMKSKPGNMTKGIDEETLDGISISDIDNIIDKLKDQSFQFRPVRRVYIPKPNGKLRPLGIPSPRDKLVQGVMKIVLEATWEPLFKDCNTGFRPGRNQHTALKQVSKWNGITWVIEGDIKAFFDTVDHSILADMLAERIKDKRFIDLYWKLVKAGYVEITPHKKKSDRELKPTDLGVPQGGVISPLLSNIYLHAFDEFMSVVSQKFSSNSRNISKVNPSIASVYHKISKLYTRYKACGDKDLLTEIRSLTKLKNSMPSGIRTGYRIHYVRYAHDWIVGVIGPKSLAETVLSEIQAFLKDALKIELSLDKTRITHMPSERAKFLGVYFNVPKSKEAKIVHRRTGRGLIKSRINQVRPYFYAPFDEIIAKLKSNGFIKEVKLHTVVTGSIPKWIFLDHRNIVHRYNAVIRGYLNYFSFVDNYSKFVSIVKFILRHSCAKTLARKFRLYRRAAVFKKFGTYLKTLDDKPVGLYIPDTFRKTRKFQETKTLRMDPMDILNWRVKSQFDLFACCWVCGREDGIEMHHVKHLRKSNKIGSGFIKVMSALNRKQIPVCASCHRQIHAGLYDGISLSKLKGK